MQFDDYLNIIEYFANVVIKNEIDLHTFICQGISHHNRQLTDSIHFRKQFLTKNEVLVFRNFTFSFHVRDAEEALACVGFCFDIEKTISRKYIKRICSPYNTKQIVFDNFPYLFNKLRNGELVDYNDLEQIDDSEIFKINDNYVYLEDYINPMFIKWVKDELKDANIYIRIKADRLYSKQPMIRFLEEILIPPDPNWIKSLKIYSNSVKKASFILQEPSKGHSIQYIWDYKVRQIRRLEIRAQRDTNGNLRLMVEEIPAVNRHDGYFIGLCVHLDTNDKAGTKFSESILNHIDLAINVYMDDKMNKRFEQSLTNGIVEDASFRTHLVRLENVPFKILINLINSSFRSKTLVNEWIEAQFKGINS